MKKVVFEVYTPEGKIDKTFDTLKNAKIFINKKNEFIPSWHYEKLWKVGCKVITC